MLYTLQVSPCYVCVISETQQQIPGILARPAASTANEMKWDSFKNTEKYKRKVYISITIWSCFLMIYPLRAKSPPLDNSQI